MDLSAPYLAVMSKDEGAVLSVLAGTNKPMSGREVARFGGAARSTAARILRRLVDHGLVRAEKAGAPWVYTLNREHLAVEPILALVHLRGRLVERLAAEIDSWPLAARHASLFGSAARGDGDVDSDIDLFLVRPAGVEEEQVQWRENADALPRRIRAWIGNHAGVAEVPEGDIPCLVRERPRIVRDMRRDAVTLAGVEVRELLAGLVA